MNTHGQVPVKAETVQLNGIGLYYEIYGQGEPLLLLHGWTQSSQSWKEHIPDYARRFQVIAVDLRGHGNTSPLTADFSIRKAAEDVHALLNHLKQKPVKAIGLSYGGIILLQLAATYPQLIDAMVTIGAAYNYSGKDNQTQHAAISFENLPSELVDQLKGLHHHGMAQIKALFDPGIDYEIRLSSQDLQRIQAKTLVISGDNDQVAMVHTAFKLHQVIPHSHLWVIPNAGHTPIYGEQKEDFIQVTTKFLSDSQ
ncbi:alpha/beta hydrolase [Nibrella saemangeumensis]